MQTWIIEHTYSSYRDFLLRTLKAFSVSSSRMALRVLVIGDVADPGKDPLPLAAQYGRISETNRPTPARSDRRPSPGYKIKSAVSGAKRKAKQRAAIVPSC